LTDGHNAAYNALLDYWENIKSDYKNGNVKLAAYKAYIAISRDTIVAWKSRSESQRYALQMTVETERKQKNNPK